MSEVSALVRIRVLCARISASEPLFAVAGPASPAGEVAAGAEGGAAGVVTAPASAGAAAVSPAAGAAAAPALAAGAAAVPAPAAGRNRVSLTYAMGSSTAPAAAPATCAAPEATPAAMFAPPPTADITTSATIAVDTAQERKPWAVSRKNTSIAVHCRPFCSEPTGQIASERGGQPLRDDEPDHSADAKRSRRSARVGPR